jgi:hypothetical protein
METEEQMQSFTLLAGESCQVLSAGGAQTTLVYSISVTDASGLELKIIRDTMDPLILSAKQKHKAIDVVTTGNLYLEAVGKQGKISGTYNCVGFSR